MGTFIQHNGVVDRAADGRLTIVISSDGGNCTGCAIASLCSKGERVEIPYPGASSDMVGRKVILTITIGAHRKAMLLMLAVPIMLLIGVISIAMWAGATEAVAAIASVVVTATWLTAVYMLRDKLLKSNPIEIEIVD